MQGRAGDGYSFASTGTTPWEVVRYGAGIGVMPCMSGDCDPTLSRAGPIFEELTETQHQVCTVTLGIRGPSERSSNVSNIHEENTALLAGEHPLRA